MSAWAHLPVALKVIPAKRKTILLFAEAVQLVSGTPPTNLVAASCFAVVLSLPGQITRFTKGILRINQTSIKENTTLKMEAIMYLTDGLSAKNSRIIVTPTTTAE